MGNSLFSDCQGCFGKKSSKKGFERLHDNGSSSISTDTRGGYVSTRRIEQAQNSSSTIQPKEKDSGAASAGTCSDVGKGDRRSRRVGERNVSTGAMGSKESSNTGSVQQSCSATSALKKSSRAANESACQLLGRNGTSHSGGVIARPAARMVHAHPNAPRGGVGVGLDPRLGGRGAGTHYGAINRGGGRMGTTSAVSGGMVARGRPRAVPTLAGSMISKYELKEVLGVGSTSTCYRCMNKSTKKHFACKVIDKRMMETKLKPLLAQFQVEIQVLQILRHPNIIHLEDVFESDIKIHMVMEIMLGGELFDYVVEKGTLSESEASVLVRKVTSALAYMHSLDIIHRDLKPENLLLTAKGANSEVKIIDFGLAKILGSSNDGAQSFLGTRGYLAPEMLQRESYNKAVDVWALGVIVFVLLCGCLPFDDDSKKLNKAGALQKFVLRFPRWAQNLSRGAKDLLSKLLTVTPQARITAQQAMEHPWVTGKVAAADKFLESPRTLRKLPRMNSPNKAGGRKTYGANAPRLAAEAAAAAAEAQRRAEFEEQSNEYGEDGSAMGGPRVRKNSV